MRHPVFPGLLLLGSLLSSSAAASVVTQSRPEDPPISTDRPGFLFAPTTVPKGRLQIETGIPTYTLFCDSGDESRLWTASAALRYGLTESMELRATLPAWANSRVEAGAATSDADGITDAEIGAKWTLPELGGGPLAFQVGLRVPTGHDDFTTDEFGASALLLHGRDIGSSYWLQTMAGVIHTPVDGGEDQTQGALAALVSHPIADRWSAYVEGTAFPGLSHAAGQSYVGGAVVFAPHRNMQLDLSADFGLDDDSADVIAALGFSFRF